MKKTLILAAIVAFTLLGSGSLLFLLWILPGFGVRTPAQSLTQTKLVVAEEVLAEIDSSHGGYYPSGNTKVDLPPKELEKVVAELRSRFPLESLSHRLAFEDKNLTTTETEAKITLTETSEDAIARVDKQFRNRIKLIKTKSLARLHSNQVESFINRDGFGFSRRPPNMDATPTNLYDRSKPTPYVMTPVATNSGMVESALVHLESGSMVSKNGLPGLGVVMRFHKDNQLQFASPETVGYFKDRDNVAGFQPHRLAYPAHWDGSALEKRKRPGTHDWKANRIELVSLLVHETPVVYASDQLPTMESIDERETRALTSFEEFGLKKLESGEQIHVSANLNRIEMMGAIRMAKACMKCHNGPSGKLLGAFSYELLRDPQLKQKSAKGKPTSPNTL